MIRLRLDRFINVAHEQVIGAGHLDWNRSPKICRVNYGDKPGPPPLLVRPMGGAFVRWFADHIPEEQIFVSFVRDRSCRYFFENALFRHYLPLDRCLTTRACQYMREEKLPAFQREDLDAGCRMGVEKCSDSRREAADMTVQPRNVAFPAKGRSLYKALELPVTKARNAIVRLHQNRGRKGRAALEGCIHVRQVMPARKALHLPGTCLGRVIKNFGRKTAINRVLQNALRQSQQDAERIRNRHPRDNGAHHCHALPALKAEHIGNGKEHRPLEFDAEALMTIPIRKLNRG